MSTKTSRSKSKSPKKASQSVVGDDQIDELIANITLKRPRSGYTHFCMDEIEKFRNKNKNKKFILKEFSKECASKWAELSDKEKKKYNSRFEEDKAKYKNDVAIIRHYLFKDYNDVVRRPPTAYRIYLNEKLLEGFEKNLDPKAVKTQASRDWKVMEPEEKQVYMDRKAENDTWFERAKQTRKVTALSMFVQKTIQTAKDKKKEVPTIAEIAPAWKKLSSAEKEKYKRYAADENEDRERLVDIFELVNGVKPKRPAGAFRVFLQEKAKEDALHSLGEGKELWDKLSEEEKEVYLKKAHRCRLAYKYKKMIYNKKIKKVLPKKPANAYAQFLKDKKGQKIPKGEKAVAYWREEFENLSKDKKRKYEDKAAKDRERYAKKMEEFNKYVFDMPKRPLNAFSLYVKDRMPDLKSEKKNSPASELIKQIAKEWQKEDGVSQKKYEKKAEVDKKRFKTQLRDFEKLGYYKKNYRAERSTSDNKSSKSTKSRSKSRSKSRKSKSRKKKEEDEEEEDWDDEEDEEEEEEEKPKRKKRSTSSNSKKGSKKSKTQETKRMRSKSSKKSGKSQKKK